MLRREDRGAEGAEWDRVWGGVSPSPLPTGEGVWRGGCAPPQKIFRFFEASFGAFWVLFCS